MKHQWIIVPAIAIILTIILTWPFLLNIISYYTDQGDYPLNGTVLWYNQDAIKTGRILNQQEYFNGYQFYPLPYTLAYGNNSLVPSIIFAPIYWISGSLPFSVNSYALLTLILSFVTSFYAINYFAKNWWASIVGAFIFTFNANTQVRFPQHLDILSKYFLPLVFLFAYQFLQKPNLKNSLLLFSTFTLNALTVNYYLIFSVVILPLVALPNLITNLIKKNWMYFLNLVKFSLVFLIFLPILVYFDLPYLQFAQKEGIKRSVEATEFFSARINDWFAASPDNLIYGAWVKSIDQFRTPKDDRGILNYEEHTLFLGILPMVLFLVGLRTFHRQNINKSFFYILLLVSFIFTFGPYLLLFKYVYKALPFMQGIRVPTRFEFIFFIPFALISSFGALWLFRKLAKVNITVITIIIIITFILENFTVKDFSSRSLILSTLDRINSQNLTLLQDKAVLHLPIYGLEDADVFGKNSAYLVWLTQTKELIVNGNSAYLPSDQLTILDKIRLQGLNEENLKILKMLGTSYIVIHKDRDVEIVDVAKFNIQVNICSLDKDFDIQLAKGRDDNFNLSNMLVLQNKSDCFLVSSYENRYQEMPVTIEGGQRRALFRLPVVIRPREQIVLSEINGELRIK